MMRYELGIYPGHIGRRPGKEVGISPDHFHQRLLHLMGEVSVYECEFIVLLADPELFQVSFWLWSGFVVYPGVHVGKEDPRCFFGLFPERKAGVVASDRRFQVAFDGSYGSVVVDGFSPQDDVISRGIS
ncbi:uncharacterized protein DS421_11g348010 [Arachis hypogaea]|nr:uncharacterized protein DS421_11g348010 [Arachis hypogaea]